MIRGLEGVVAATTRLCDLDGANGRLAYQGYDIEDLARHASFEEVVWLLWHGELPRAGRADRLPPGAGRGAPRSRPRLLKALKLLPKTMHPMRVLQTGVALLGGLDPDAEDDSPRGQPAEGDAARRPRVVPDHGGLPPDPERAPTGRAPAGPLARGQLPLHALGAEAAASSRSRAFDAALVLYAEHELNASTFTARVIASTLSDMHSAVSAAIGALKGPLHGGAGEAVMRTLEEIGQPDRADAFTRQALAEKRRLMGFGHRVYKAGDPRAKILRALAAKALPAVRRGASGTRRRSSSTRPSTGRRG